MRIETSKTYRVDDGPQATKKHKRFNLNRSCIWWLCRRVTLQLAHTDQADRVDSIAFDFDVIAAYYFDLGSVKQGAVPGSAFKQHSGQCFCLSTLCAAVDVQVDVDSQAGSNTVIS